ncbi:hypothetical protein, partial [Brachyspira hyodysenteriae]|uniref:hypothetical protein n=1 Tax=Brachyspira hyodysenteriae TaxID=159 RepID=UPI0011777E15
MGQYDKVCLPYHIDPLINHKIPETIASFGINVITEEGLEIVDSLADVHAVSYTHLTLPTNYAFDMWI